MYGDKNLAITLSQIKTYPVGLSSVFSFAYRECAFLQICTDWIITYFRFYHDLNKNL
ncbi:hypothetical protein SAMN04487995_0682 [Dyadobacter koreensis]|uniref:Uncharacterized protein n=1 Tax=Dyadobacter koreensis TaxID=408657 RepID=A0A1H6QHT0_9BACT|nr:hypothetical protein SAMN04487995_0682 [Dyadobacter koreensis]